MENENKDALRINCMHEILDTKDPLQPKTQISQYYHNSCHSSPRGDIWNEIADWAASKKEWLETLFTF